jgi:MerR family mercuric resistance operon transcriptional regulator
MVRSQEPTSLTIGQLAERGGVGVETIRFYQRKELLPTPVRDAGIRRYGSEELRRLRFIRQAQAAGFSLEEIRELLELNKGSDRIRARELATSRVEALDRRIAELKTAREALQRLAEECRQGDIGPCPILSSFEI